MSYIYIEEQAEISQCQSTKPTSIIISQQMIGIPNQQRSQIQQQIQQYISCLSKIINKLPTLMFFHDQQLKGQKSNLSKNSFQQLENQSFSTKYNDKIPFSQKIDDMVDQLAQIFDLYQVNNKQIGQQFLKLTRAVNQKFQLLKSQITQMSLILNHKEDNNINNTHSQIMKKLKTQYVRVIRSKHKHIPSKINCQPNFNKDSNQNCSKNSERIEQKQFIKYLLSSIKQVKQIHENQLYNYMVTIEKKQAQLVQCRMEVANIMNRNQELCEDIAELKEKIGMYEQELLHKQLHINKINDVVKGFQGNERNMKAILAEIEYLKNYLQQYQLPYSENQKPILDKVGLQKSVNQPKPQQQKTVLSLFNLLLNRNQQLVMKLATLSPQSRYIKENNLSPEVRKSLKNGLSDNSAINTYSTVSQFQ